MPDLLFADVQLAALYDRMNSGRDDFNFYMPMVLAAGAVLDVGCGTGAMLHEARSAGHRGRLCGLDPAHGMLAQARNRTDVEWFLGDLSSVVWENDFDLIVMTGHAFQVLVEDDELRSALAAIRAALRKGGRFAFETRNPLARAWETWDHEACHIAHEPRGASVRMTRRVVSPFDGRVVSFSHTFESDAWDQARVSHSTLRFLDKAALNRKLAQAGLSVEAQFGDWDRSLMTDTSPEIITIAGRM